MLEWKYQNYVEQLETGLSYYLPETPDTPEILREAMEYSLLAGGKRVRPVLALATADLLLLHGSQKREVMAYAVALEMIHTYSLIHDDLPAMDNDVLRRGKPTNHVVFGEATAILAGDALLTRAFEIFGGYMDGTYRTSCSLLNIAKAFGKLAQYAGCSGMIGGQILDIEAEGEQLTLEELQTLQAKKTGCLLEAPVVGIGLICGAKNEELAILQSYAQAVGKAFQIKDDILDVESTTQELGKTVGKDQKYAKATYVTLLGMDEAKAQLKKAESAAEQACDQLTAMGYDTEFFRFLSGKMAGRSY